jgi:hypothetical protein
MEQNLIIYCCYLSLDQTPTFLELLAIWDAIRENMHLTTNNFLERLGWNNANQLVVFATYGTTLMLGWHVGLITCLK